MNKTKRKIFETSMKLFAEKGYDATSIEEITATVGVAKGTLYYHFSSKEEIFNFLVEEGMKLLKNSIDIKTAKLTIQEVGVTKEENTNEEPSTESSETSSISTEETPHEIKELPPLETPKQDIVMETGVTKEERTETRNLYGTSCNYLITTYYDVLSDGSKKETGTSEKFIDCDYSGFNPNSEEFELEAASSAKTYLYYLANVIVYVNQKRTELGLPDLELNDNLLAASSIRALEMGYSNKFSTQRPHTSQNILDENSIPYIEAKEFVFKDISEPAIIAQNLFSNRDALSSIQNTDYDSIGVGLALVHDHYYWSIYLANLS